MSAINIVSFSATVAQRTLSRLETLSVYQKKGASSLRLCVILKLGQSLRSYVNVKHRGLKMNGAG